MTQNLATFDFGGNQIRVVHINDRPWWVASDLATALEYANTPDMVRMLDDDQKGMHKVHTLGGLQQATIVSESGMWTCVIRSNKPEAKRFVRILTDEILPEIRRKGFYALPGVTLRAPSASVSEFLRVSNALKVERNRTIRAQLWSRLDQITDAWGLAPTARAIGYDEPDYSDLLAIFWTAIQGLEEVGIQVNHSRRNDLIALNMPEIRRHLAELGSSVEIDRKMMKALRACPSPRFVAEKPVNCRDGQYRSCWVFSNIEPALPATVE